MPKRGRNISLVNRRPWLLTIVLLAVFLLSLFSLTQLSLTQPTDAEPGDSSDNESPKALRDEMKGVLEAFRKLQPFIVRREKFLDVSSESEIATYLQQLQGGFHRAGIQGARYSTEPGFTTTLRTVNQMLDDARLRFGEGKKGYALWRLRTAANYCVTCHTRHRIDIDFVDTGEVPEGLSPLEEGEFYLATRQFAKAKEAFLKAARSRELGVLRIEALRKWLVVAVRVNPDPAGAAATLRAVVAEDELPLYDAEEVELWIAGLSAWSKETASQGSALTQAERLVERGLRQAEALAGHRNTVELLRATAILHGALEAGPAVEAKNRARMLYLLGLAYSELPFFFVNELPELFLEKVIRDYPSTDEAKQAYRLYRKVVTLGFTGSAGTRIPDDVQLLLKELHGIAHGVPQSPSRS